MARISAHAKERLKQRYNISSVKDIEKICCLLNQPQSYNIVSSQHNREVRQIAFNGISLQAVVNANSILTFIPLTFEAGSNDEHSVEDHRFRIEKINSRIETQSKKIKSQNEKLQKMLDNKFPISFVYFLYYRMIKNRDSSKGDKL